MARRTILTASAAVILAFSLLVPPALAGGAKEGWGRYAGFIGRYHVKVLAAGGSGVRGGALTMFVQEEFPGSEAPAGILNLRTRANNDVVYLKELKSRGQARTAVVKGGSFLGPTIGRLVGRQRAPGRIVAGVSTRSLGSMKLLFTRYSRKPTQ